MIACQAPLDIKLIINKSHNVTDERSIFRDQLTKKSPKSLLCWPQILHHHIAKGRTITYTICGRDRRLCVDKSLTWLYTNVNYFARLVNDLLPNVHCYLQCSGTCLREALWEIWLAEKFIVGSVYDWHQLKENHSVVFTLIISLISCEITQKILKINNLTVYHI